MLRNSNFADDLDNRLEVATEKGNYEYWLTQEDIADLIRIVYENFGQKNEQNSFREFEIIGSPEQLREQLLNFKLRTQTLNNARLTLIVNIDQRHWVTLLVNFEEKHYKVYFIDSFKQWLPESYRNSLAIIPSSFEDLSGYCPQQTDGFNCGLWALENAQLLTEMIDKKMGPHWIINQLQRSYLSNYFSERRRFFSKKLNEDPARQKRFSQSRRVVPLATNQQLSSIPMSSGSSDEPNPKKIKLDNKINLQEKLDYFVQSFIESLTTRLATYSLIAKEKRLTNEGLKAELKIGFAGALWGMSLTQNLAGSVPSGVATVRGLSIHSGYLTPKNKAQKITRIFSGINPNKLKECLVEAAIEIFQSYEQPFMEVSDKAGHKMAIYKIADDAAGRALNYLDKSLTENTSITRQVIVSSVLLGESESYFNPSLKKTRLRFKGNHIQDKEGHSFSTASLFEKVGIIIKRGNTNSDLFYKKNFDDSTHYGYRRPLSWEIDSVGKFKVSEQQNYIADSSSNVTPYDYQLNFNSIQQEAAQVLQRISTPFVNPNKITTIKNIIFNLRRPLKNFSGRNEHLIKLHQVLSSDEQSAVVTQMERLSLSPVDGLTQPIQENNQATVSGLGGIGKTQLALKYANQYAEYYDSNVIWIDSEKKMDIVESFEKLARKLAINLNDDYGNKKESNELIEEVYNYFSSVKSLFIFDNVESAKEIKDILPKSSTGNKPTILITSRYTNWVNIATPINLGVFTEEEARIFIKNELAITGNEKDIQITELAKLLQWLPLAIQQAVAYIHSQKTLDNHFSIRNYIDEFKKKQSNKELLDFDLSQHKNDPYSKTVLTTWEITLDKIKKEKLIGPKAIETIQIMAYLYPDQIYNNMFRSLPNDNQLGSVLYLLKSYSLISEGSEPHISTIHRLVQKVLRIKVESNQIEFEKIIKKVIFMTKTFSRKELITHYFYCFLHILEHRQLIDNLSIRKESTQKILEMVASWEDRMLLHNLLDDAQATLLRENYLQFIGKAIVIYTRYPFLMGLDHTLNYIEKKIKEGLISREELKFILEYKYRITRKECKPIRLSTNPNKRSAQLRAIGIVFDFEYKYFQKDSSSCTKNRSKRGISTLCMRTEDEPFIERPMDTSQIKAHINKVRLIANLANFSLLSKDTLSALIQGDFESIAINFSLLSGSRISGKISNKLLVKGGEQLALSNEKLLLNKELDYDTKLAASLFTDKEIMIAGKRRFLGNTMRASAPFVERGTALFFAYNFVKGLNSNETDLLDNLSNVAIVGLDVGEAGIEALEYLSYFAEISELTGPIGEGLGFLIIGGMQLYHVEQELKAIEKWVHLSVRETFIEGIRAFLNFQPSAYLEAKANNDKLVNQTINFLKLHSDIQRYVYFSGFPAVSLDKEQLVLLDQRRNLTLLTDDIPQNPEGDFFCLAGLLPANYSTDVSQIENKLADFVESTLEHLVGTEKRNLHLCVNATGIEYTMNRTGNTTLIALQGNSTVIGAHSNTIFLVSNGHQFYWAGNRDDLFILQGNQITGHFQGNLGINIVKFSDYQLNDGVLLDPRGILCGRKPIIHRNEFFIEDVKLNNIRDIKVTSQGVGITMESKHGIIHQLSLHKNTSFKVYEEYCSNGLKLSNITQIHGRKSQQDKIFLIKNITVVDFYGGESLARPDYIYITEKSAKSIDVVIRPHTIVHVLPRNSTDNFINHKIPANQTNDAYVRLSFHDTTIHRFYFDSSIDSINALNIINNTISFQVDYLDEFFSLTIQDINSIHAISNETTTKNFFIQSASYSFDKKLEVRLLNEKTLYAHWHSNNSIDEIIQIVVPMAYRIDKAILLQTIQNETIAIGGKHQKILSTDGSVVNHLVSNAEEVVYVIQAPQNLTDSFSVNNISLYTLKSNTFITTMGVDTLDLRDVIKKAKSQCSEQNILPIFNEQNEDLVLTLSSNYDFSTETGCKLLVNNSRSLLNILLKGTLNDDWYQNLDIIFHNRSMNIIYNEDSWKIVPTPLVFDRNKNIITISNSDVYKDDEFFVLKNLEKYDFIRYNDTDLILTNLFNNVTTSDLYTILFGKFFEDLLFKEKVLSLNINFLDESLLMSNHTQKINNAMDFNLLIKSYFNSSDILSNQSGVFFDDSTIVQSVARKRRDTDSPLPISSASTRVSSDAYAPFIYFPSKIIQFTRFILNKLSMINDAKVYYQEKEELLVLKRTKYPSLQQEKEKNLLVYCEKKDVFTKENCVKNQSTLGLLGYCANTNHGIIWFSKNSDEAIASKLSWFAIIEKHMTANTSMNDLNRQESNLFLQADYLYFSPKEGCQQVIDLNRVSNTTLTTLMPYLPEEGKQWLFNEWRYEKSIYDKIQQDQLAITLFKQQALQVSLNYVGSTWLLHTFIGDYFQTLSLNPSWREHDPSYFLARWLSVAQQLSIDNTNKTSMFAAALLETSLLHPKIQMSYFSLWPNAKIRYKKQALRFCADLLQGDSLHFSLIPNLLELLFSDYLPSQSIIWGIRAFLSFYRINQDPSYYYLGIALFVLPQLPLLLEHLGVPVTAYVSKTLEKITQLFIFKSLLEQFKPVPDQSRIIQRDIELKEAEQRVAQGNTRISKVVKPLVSFFKPSIKPSTMCCMENEANYNSSYEFKSS